MKKIFAILLLLSITVSLVACGNSNDTDMQNDSITNDQNDNATEQPEPTAYEKLNYNEKLIFDTLIININNMNNPVSIKVLEVASHSRNEIDNLDDTTSSLKTYFIRLMGQNASGGTITKWCEIAYADYTTKDLYGNSIRHKTGEIEAVDSFYSDTKYPMFSSNFYNADVSKINAALQEHWKKMGLV